MYHVKGAAILHCFNLQVAQLIQECQVVQDCRSFPDEKKAVNNSAEYYKLVTYRVASFTIRSLVSRQALFSLCSGKR